MRTGAGGFSHQGVVDPLAAITVAAVWHCDQMLAGMALMLLAGVVQDENEPWHAWAGAGTNGPAADLILLQAGRKRLARMRKSASWPLR
ncbi:hypothetical protein ACLB1S_08870 [Escherichia coli]